MQLASNSGFVPGGHRFVIPPDNRRVTLNRMDAVQRFLDLVGKDGELDWQDVWASASHLIGTDRIREAEYDAWIQGIEQRIADGSLHWSNGGERAYRALRRRMDPHRVDGLVAPNLSRARMRAIALQARRQQTWPVLARDIRVPSIDFRMPAEPEAGPVFGTARVAMPLSALVNDPIHADLLLSNLRSIRVAEPFGRPGEAEWSLEGVGHRAVLTVEIPNARGSAWHQIPPMLRVDFGNGPQPLRLFADALVVDHSPSHRRGWQSVIESRTAQIELHREGVAELRALLADPEARRAVPTPSRLRLGASREELALLEGELRERLREIRPRLNEASTGELRVVFLRTQPTGDSSTDVELERAAIRIHRWQQARNVHAPMAALLEALREVEPDPAAFAERFADLIDAERDAFARVQRSAARVAEARDTLLREPLHPKLWNAAEQVLLGARERPVRHVFEGIATWSEQVAEDESRWRAELEAMPAELESDVARIESRIETALRDIAEAREALASLQEAPAFEEIATGQADTPGRFIEPDDDAFWRLVEARSQLRGPQVRLRVE